MSEAAEGFSGVWERARRIDGWLTEEQARTLYDAARSLAPPPDRQGTPRRIVEIGSFRGRSTTVLALAAPAGVEVVAIDPHAGGDRGPQEIRADATLGQFDHEAFQANLDWAGAADLVRHVRRASQDALGAVDGPLDLLYVDGAHRFAFARADLALWGARVVPGGRLLVHDAFSSVGVTLALAHTIIGRAAWSYRGRVGSLASFERRLGAANRPRHARVAGLADAARATAELPWFARNLLIKALIVARLPGAARLLGHRSGPWPY